MSSPGGHKSSELDHIQMYGLISELDHIQMYRLISTLDQWQVEVCAIYYTDSKNTHHVAPCACVHIKIRL